MSEKLAEDIISEFGEKIVVLRHDIDNVYTNIGSYKRLKLATNWFLLASGRIGDKMSLLAPNRLELVEELLDLETAIGARATYFFRSVTAPSKKLTGRLKAKGHHIGYHADSMKLKVFMERLEFLRRTTGEPVRSFTWHGFSKVRSGGYYDEKKLLHLGRIGSLEILAQGVGHPEWATPMLVNNIWVFGHSTSMKRHSIERIIEYVSSRHIPLLLVHPEDVLGRNERKGQLEDLLSKFRGISAEELIDKLAAMLKKR